MADMTGKTKRILIGCVAGLLGSAPLWWKVFKLLGL